ncbi:amidase [Pedobacter sp. KBW06]|uniref:amidase family protein n=1 Tax=Pedobacter sp. KBW06 TaxID=2153359 RepID=UPI000F598D3E|nr:amidase family protein [Pedobacter sp. KBW06]RQO71853.1 amidase [Pedobacter sp. KBW06]
MYRSKVVFTFIIAVMLSNALFAQTAEKEKRFDQIQSRTLKHPQMEGVLRAALVNFSDQKYRQLKPFIFDRSIPEIQKAVQEGKLSYEELTLFYLYRISKYETSAGSSLHAVIDLNPNVLKEARARDLQSKGNKHIHGIFGMPVLLKDNIGAENMNTTAGALALAENQTTDAFIVKQLKAHGALILGKVNLSEWAYFFCLDCPSGYSGVGGHTLNPYGPGTFDTGGSSSGSAVAVAANYAVAAIGTETAGSILSPSSQNSVVGLKPTLGLLSRSGIIPLSSTFDTPGPITKSVIDNAILLSAMLGKDKNDAESVGLNEVGSCPENLSPAVLTSKKIGVIKEYLNIPLYAQAVAKLKEAGATMLEIDLKPSGISGNDFGLILKDDLKQDLIKYFKVYGKRNIKIRSLGDVLAFNQQNMALNAPYGQAQLELALKDTTLSIKVEEIRRSIIAKSRGFLDRVFSKDQLDVILSVNNYNAFEAAVAKYPAMCLPMGYDSEGQPMALTFIARPFEECKLLELGAAWEKIQPIRKGPQRYND